MTPEEILATTEGDPEGRAVAAQGWLERVTDSITRVQKIRDDAVIELRTDHSQRRIAAMLGLSPSAVAAIEKRRT